MAYRGPSDFGHKYGVQMKLAFMIVVTMEMETAFFSLVCEQTLPHQPRIRELTPYVPMVKIIMLTYLPAVFMAGQVVSDNIFATVCLSGPVCGKTY